MKLGLAQFAERNRSLEQILQLGELAVVVKGPQPGTSFVPAENGSAALLANHAMVALFRHPETAVALLGGHDPAERLFNQDATLEIGLRILILSFRTKLGAQPMNSTAAEWHNAGVTQQHFRAVVDAYVRDRRT